MFTAYIQGNEYILADKVYSGTDAVGKMCRDLGHGTLKIYRGESLVLTVNVEKRKTKALTDNDKRLAYTDWKPFPDARGWSRID